MLLFFFFKQKTAYEMRISDWSSDVCSSDLPRRSRREQRTTRLGLQIGHRHARCNLADLQSIWRHVDHCKIRDDAIDDADAGQRQIAFFENLDRKSVV